MAASTSIQTYVSGITIQPNETFHYGAPGSAGNYYAFAPSNVASTVSGQQAVITVVNGWGNLPAQTNGPWCSVTNTSASAATYDLLLLTVAA